MNEKILTIKYEKDFVRVTGNAEGISRLNKWIKEHKRGTFTADSIICKTSTDFLGCKQKAKFLKLSVINPSNGSPKEPVLNSI